jgi:hypothetical protein
MLISLSFIFLGRNMKPNEINGLTFKSDRLLEPHLLIELRKTLDGKETDRSSNQRAKVVMDAIKAVDDT